MAACCRQLVQLGVSLHLPADASHSRHDADSTHARCYTRSCHVLNLSIASVYIPHGMAKDMPAANIITSNMLNAVDDFS